jgi:hypothetical protein
MPFMATHGLQVGPRVEVCCRFGAARSRAFYLDLYRTGSSSERHDQLRTHSPNSWPYTPSSGGSSRSGGLTAYKYIAETRT